MTQTASRSLLRSFSESRDNLLPVATGNEFTGGHTEELPEGHLLLLLMSARLKEKEAAPGEFACQDRGGRREMGRRGPVFPGP